MVFPEEMLKLLDEDCSVIDGPEAPRWMRDMVLYQVYTRNFSREGTFQGVIEGLDRIRGLGATAIWLVPIHPIGMEGRKGSLGCPYSVADYFDVSPEYGSREDFRRLVGEVHRRGMRIFIDLVANHGAIDHVEAKPHPDWFYTDREGRHTRREKEWADVIDINYCSREAWDYMKKAARFWVEEMDIDGYRCDVAGMVPLAFWEELAEELRRIKPDFYMVAEWDCRPHLCRKAFNSDYKGDTYLEMLEIAGGRSPAQRLVELAHRNYSIYPRNNLPLNFIENHDQKRSCSAFGKEGFRPLAMFTFTIPGVPLIYNGQEIGMTEYLSLFDRMPVEWERGGRETEDFYRGLTALRKSHPATRDGRFMPLPSDSPVQLATYAVMSPEETMAGILNLSPRQCHASVSLPAGFPGLWQLILKGSSSDRFSMDGGKISVSLGPHGFLLLSSNPRQDGQAD